MNLFFLYKHRIILIGFFIVGAILRLWDITEHSYWIDELYSAARAIPEKDLLDVYYWGPEPHPPAHYILLWISYNLFGYHEIVGKLISAIAGTLCIPAIYFLGKTMFSKGVGFNAAILLTITPALIYYSQEARAYELLVLFSILSSYFFLLIQDKRTYFYTFLYLISSIFLINLHFYGIWIFAAQVIFISISLCRSLNKKDMIFYLFTSSIIFASYIPLISQMIQAASNGITWIQGIEITTYLFEAFSAYFGSANMFRPYQVTEISLVGLAFFALFAISFAKLAMNKRFSKGFCYISLVFFFVYIVSILMEAVLAPMFNNRNSLPALPFIILVIAWCLNQIEIKRIYVLSSIGVFLILSNVNFYNNLERENWREVIKQASIIKSPYENKNHIYVSAWEGEWSVYKRWLDIDDMEIMGLKDLQIENYEQDDLVWVLWATIQPQDLEHNKTILDNLTKVESIETNRAGLIQYKISK